MKLSNVPWKNIATIGGMIHYCREALGSAGSPKALPIRYGQNNVATELLALVPAPATRRYDQLNDAIHQ
ncbi:hypothetical protein [Stenotrophomonas maltophilia]|uniref:hypothetical protein n=1 Tax=Stenotrophomonas maltophilia TaxID=40324 RepID=UPI0012FBD567|nr:hypothetical protein [Stenotrophomonas maltophilia]MBH1635399.1 hypothetical protein [Stenotrophomonas maltophilia]